MRTSFCVLTLALAGALCLQTQPTGFRFVVLGDRTGNADQAVYERVWRDVAAEHPAFVLNVGDTIQGGNDATAQAEWDALRPVWSLPQFFSPGNHDIWSSASRKIYEAATRHPPSYGFDYRGAHFTVLDNSGSLNLDEEQMKFLQTDLQRNRDKNPKFVSFHQPFWLLPLKFQSGEFPFHRLAKKYGVAAVFSGHGHQFVRLERDGIVYLEAGSSGAKLKGQGFAQGWFFGHTTVDVSAGNIKIVVHETGPPFGESRVLNPLN